MRPLSIELEGFFAYRKRALVDLILADGDPRNLYGAADNPLISLNVFTGDLNMDTGESQSVYVLDKSKAEPLPGKNGQPYRIDLSIGETFDAIGETCYRSWTMTVADARAQRAIPVGLLEGGKVTAPVKKGDLLTRANAAPDPTTRLFALRQRQDQMLGSSS